MTYNHNLTKETIILDLYIAYQKIEIRAKRASNDNFGENAKALSLNQ